MKDGSQATISRSTEILSGASDRNYEYYISGQPVYLIEDENENPLFQKDLSNLTGKEKSVKLYNPIKRDAIEEVLNRCSSILLCSFRDQDKPDFENRIAGNDTSQKSYLLDDIRRHTNLLESVIEQLSTLKKEIEFLGIFSDEFIDSLKQ